MQCSLHKANTWSGLDPDLCEQDAVCVLGFDGDVSVVLMMCRLCGCADR